LSFFFWPLLLNILFILAIVVFFPFYFGHCYGISFVGWLLITSWYLQTFLTQIHDIAVLV
jgi:hypothetical protein